MNDQTNLIAFKSICNFINDVNSVVGNKYKQLKLYNRLINKTQISHDNAIKKHIGLFYTFCIDNRESLMEQNFSKLTNTKLQYSENVYIDLKTIYNLCDEDCKETVWRHLLTISAILDPAGKAKEILKKSVEEGKSGVDESNFLSDIISKVEKNINPNANPMEAMSSMMSSGVFNELLSGMQGGLSSGKLDMNKLLGAVQSMVSNLGEQVGDDPQAKQALGMINNMSTMLGKPNSNGQPDMSSMMSMMSSMMSGMNNNNKIEEISEKKHN